MKKRWDAIQEFLQRHGCSVQAETIIEQVMRGVPHQKMACRSGDMHLIQFYHPVTMRQEVFLGNVFFNAYLGLGMKRALELESDIDFLPVFHDLESYYYLVHTNLSLEELMQRVRQAWIDGLEDLYFSEPIDQEAQQYAENGYYGRFSKMLENYFKSNIQPFPLMVVPLQYAGQLEERIRSYLLNKLETGEWQTDIANFTANFSYFYGQTSGGTGDVQSCPNFLRRLVAEYEVITPEEMTLAFQLKSGTDFTDSAVKNEIQERLFRKGNTPAFYVDKLKQVFEKALHHFADSIAKQTQQGGERSEWLFRYHREKKVFLDLTPEQLVDELVTGATVAGRFCSTVSRLHTSERCLVCGYHAAQLSGATIIASDSFSKFHNHSINRGSAEKRICYNCALYAYLSIKMAGSKSGGMGQVPRNGNVVFHYGSYTEPEFEELVRRFEARLERVKRTGGEESPPAHSSEFDFGDEEADELSNLREGSVRRMLLRNDGGEAMLFPIRFGEQQLIVFLLPGLQDDVQKRFNENWYSTRTLLSWLYRLSDKKGSYYYLSMPKSKHLRNDKSVLIVQDKVYDTDEQIHLHDLYQKVVPELSRVRAKEGFKYEMIVAEQVKRDPLGRFDDEIRRRLTEGRGGLRDPDRVYDLLATLHRLMSEETEKGESLLKNREEVMERKKEVKKTLDEFSDRLFHTLDMLDLLPKSMSEKPHKFEKWARELIAPLKRTDVSLSETFEKWLNRILRQRSFYPSTDQAKFSLSEETRSKRLDLLQELKTWSLEREQVIGEHVNQLLTSLLARAFSYSYPVTDLCRFYTRLHEGDATAFTADAIRERFVNDVQKRWSELQAKGHVTDAHLHWAEQHLLMHSNYYKGFKNNSDQNGGDRS